MSQFRHSYISINKQAQMCSDPSNRLKYNSCNNRQSLRQTNSQTDVSTTSRYEIDHQSDWQINRCNFPFIILNGEITPKFWLAYTLHPLWLVSLSLHTPFSDWSMNMGSYSNLVKFDGKSKLRPTNKQTDICSPKPALFGGQTLQFMLF